MQVQVIVKFVFVQVHITDGAFLVLIVTFLEKFYLLYSLISCLSELTFLEKFFSLYSLISCLDGCHSEMQQIRYCS